MPFLDEAQVEISLVDMLAGMRYEYVQAPELAPDRDRPERMR